MSTRIFSPSDLQQVTNQIRSQLQQHIVGQERVIDELLVTVLAGGHALLVGVPGLAKTLLVRRLAEILGLQFNRVQFTPDLMPADITGTEVLFEDKLTGERQLKFLPGPLFSHLVLADEINRTPPKTQAALLESMQELQVTVGGQRHCLPQPFFVLATQNPIEQEGTYPLPEAQRDRFLLEIRVDYPSLAEELAIARLPRTGRQQTHAQPLLDAATLLSMQAAVAAVPLAEHDLSYAVALVRNTRPTEPQAPDFVKQYLRWGAGPRATQALIASAQARAVLHGRPAATWHDLQTLSKPVLRHRLITNFNAEADGMTPDTLIDRLLETVPSPEQQDRSGLRKFFG